MKSLILLAFHCLMSSILLAQPTMMHAPVERVDTIVRYVDISGRVQSNGNAVHIQKSWPENGKYRLEIYTNNGEQKLLRKTMYADISLQVLDGPFEIYYPSGSIKDSGNYLKKVRNGIFKSWYEDGTLMNIYQYANGIKIDTGKSFSKNGNLSSLLIADKEGNGKETIYFEQGGIHFSGPLTGGLRNGTWTVKREDGTNQMQADFIKDSVAQTICFADDGKTRLEGKCIFERFALFPGGKEGWRNFLMKNLKYPNAAIAKDIQGTVLLEFVVGTDGTVDDIKVISSPDEMLTNEALRLIKITPKWEPAIQFNKPVKGRLRQPFYFQLQ